MYGATIRRRLVFALALVVIGALVPQPAAAMNVSVSAVIRKSSCWRDLTWRGGAHWSGYQWKGTVDYCAYLLQVGTVDSNGRVQDGDSGADYYIFNQTVEWSASSGANWASTDSYGSLKANSTIAAINSVYNAAPRTTTSNVDCNTSISVSAGFGGFSVGVGLNLCNGWTLTRNSMSSSGAMWSSNHVPMTPYWDTAYMIKVKQGAKPAFSGMLRVPRYNLVQSGYVCGGGGCGYTYTYEKKWVNFGIAHTAP